MTFTSPLVKGGASHDAKLIKVWITSHYNRTWRKLSSVGYGWNQVWNSEWNPEQPWERPEGPLIDGLVLDCSNSSALAMELLQFCTKPTILSSEPLHDANTRFLVEMQRFHYNDVIMNAVASQITSLTIVYSTVNSGADQRKHQRSASLAFVRGIHLRPVNSPHKGQWRGKSFHLMTSSCSFKKCIWNCRW